MRQFPHLRVFPGNVHRVTKVQQQSFAAVKTPDHEEDSEERIDTGTV